MVFQLITICNPKTVTCRVERVTASGGDVGRLNVVGSTQVLFRSSSFLFEALFRGARPRYHYFVYILHPNMIPKALLSP